MTIGGVVPGQGRGQWKLRRKNKPSIFQAWKGYTEPREYEQYWEGEEPELTSLPSETKGFRLKKKRRIPGKPQIPPIFPEGLGGDLLTGGLPEDLSPQAIYKLWSETEEDIDEKGEVYSPRLLLYIAQVKDYLREKYGLDQEFLQPMARETAFIQADSEYKQLFGYDEGSGAQKKHVPGQIEAMLDFEYPVELLPYYEESSTSFGPNLQRMYEDYLEEEMDIRVGEEATRSQLSGKLSPALASAVKEGTIGLDEAYQMRKGELLGREQALSLGGRLELQKLVQAGFVSPEEAFGPGSQWEKWQHGEAGRRQPGGFDESEGAASVRYGEQSRSEQEAARQRVAEAKFYMAMMPELAGRLPGVAGLQLGQDYRPSAPDVEAQPSWGDIRAAGGGVPGGGGAISGEDILATQAMGYLQKPEGKQALSDYEMRMGEEFGGIYPAYKQAYLQGLPGGAKFPGSIEAWLGGEAPAEWKDYWKRFSGARAQRLGRRGGETIL